MFGVLVFRGVWSSIKTGEVEGVIKLKKRSWGVEMRRLLVVRVVVFGGFFFEEV